MSNDMLLKIFYKKRNFLKDDSLSGIRLFPPLCGDLPYLKHPVPNIHRPWNHRRTLVYPTRNEKALEEKTSELSHIHPENDAKYIVSIS